MGPTGSSEYIDRPRRQTRMLLLWLELKSSDGDIKASLSFYKYIWDEHFRPDPIGSPNWERREFAQPVILVKGEYNIKHQRTVFGTGKES